MKEIKIIFFGSTTDSLIVLERLFKENYHIAAVITQPPRPVGRKQIITPSPTQEWAIQHGLPVFSFANSETVPYLYKNEEMVINTLSTYKTDLLISASYGQRIPTKTISDARFGGLNIHPSLLPRWRGADPVPWQILSGDHQTGATIVTLTEKMDEGKIIAQKKIPLTEQEERESLRKKLFQIGAEVLIDSLPEYLNGDLKGQPQQEEHAVLARRLTRNDGFLPWSLLQQSIKGDLVKSDDFPQFFQQFAPPQPFNPSTLICRSIQALSPWPGVWTMIEISESKRLKILKAHVSASQPYLILDEVQLEGRKPTDFNTLNLLP